MITRTNRKHYMGQCEFCDWYFQNPLRIVVSQKLQQHIRVEHEREYKERDTTNS